MKFQFFISCYSAMLPDHLWQLRSEKMKSNQLSEYWISVIELLKFQKCTLFIGWEIRLDGYDKLYAPVAFMIVLANSSDASYSINWRCTMLWALFFISSWTWVNILCMVTLKLMLTWRRSSILPCCLVPLGQHSRPPDCTPWLLSIDILHLTKSGCPDSFDPFLVAINKRPP